MSKLKNPRWEYFCKLFASDKEFFGNGTQSYIEAYDIDVTARKGAYATARVSASELLTKPNIIDRINELLEVGVLNDAFVDKQLAFLISQNSELGTKLGALKEYNALKQRITKKMDILSDGKPLEPVIVRVISEPAGNTDTK